ncbi:transmembrane protein 107 [Ixodes scapularis]|uniref:transmembrane protein 107 n=1 Tax=Ixodes scapularis TaxID=6945 RepID=UPI001C388227|nr:transmembrane protein 107 [Ixodes scapularis]
MRNDALVPARFLTLSAHFVLLVTLLWAREDNIRACLPWGFSDADYARKDTEIVVGLSLAILLVVFELVGFFSGISMFFPSQALLSIAAHCAASIALAYYVVESWGCAGYWWIFAFCSVLPAFAELCIVVGVLVLGRTP